MNDVVREVIMNESIISKAYKKPFAEERISKKTII